MSAGAIAFMAAIWTVVLSLVIWTYSRVLKKRAHHDPDSIGPRGPAERGAHDRDFPRPTDH